MVNIYYMDSIDEFPSVTTSVSFESQFVETDHLETRFVF